MRLTMGSVADSNTSKSAYTPEQIKAYALAMYKLTAYNYALDKVNMPYLHEPSEEYKSFSETYFPAVKSHAQVWLTGILPMYSSIPLSLKTFYNNMQLMEGPIQSMINKLIDTPEDTNTLSKLRHQITTLRGSIKSNSKTVESLQLNLDNYATNLGTDLSKMQEAVTDMTSKAGTDQEKVDSLNSTLKDLKSELGKWEITLASMTGVAAVGGAIMAAGVKVFAGGSKIGGGCIIAFGVLLDSGAVITMIIGNTKIKELQEKIEEDQDGLGPLDQDITSINMFNQALQTAIDDNQVASTVMDDVKALWDTVDQELEQLENELDIIINKSASPTETNFTQILNEFNQAMIYWSSLADTAQDIDSISVQYYDDIEVIQTT